MKVKIVRKRGKAALVEFCLHGQRRRVTVPTEDVHGNQVSKENLEMGIVYGEPWEKLALVWPTPEELAMLLRENGIWTKADLLKNMNTVRGIVSKLTARIITDLRNMARE